MATLPKISAIVPCYNEEKLVSGVIKTLLATPEISEIIAVDDGSTDKTFEILKSFNHQVNLISFKKNQGKANAVAEGIRKAKGNLVLFIDADLVGLKPFHLQKMIKALFKQKAFGVLADLYSKKDPANDIFYWRVFNRFPKRFLDHDFLSGQRLYWKKDLLPLLDRMNGLGYGLEVFLNHEFRNKKIEIVRLQGIFQYPREQRNGFNYATFRSYLKEAVEVSKELARQQGIKGKEALEFRRRFIREFLEDYVNPGKKWKKMFKKYLDDLLEKLYLK